MLTTNINIQDQLINDQMTLLLDKIMLCLVNLRQYSFQSDSTVSSRTCMDITLACSTTFLSALTLNGNFVVNKYIISFSVGLPLASDHPKRCWITYKVRFKRKIISLHYIDYCWFRIPSLHVVERKLPI